MRGLEPRAVRDKNYSFHLRSEQVLHPKSREVERCYDHQAGQSKLWSNPIRQIRRDALFPFTSELLLMPLLRIHRYTWWFGDSLCWAKTAQQNRHPGEAEESLNKASLQLRLLRLGFLQTSE